MPQSLRLLFIEDSPSDAEMVLHALRIAEFDPVSVRVETEEAFRRHLASPLDLVLADFSLPEFDSLRALEIMQELQLDIPFIIVSGTIGEERAVQVMQRGATDYVIKDRLVRLGPAVKQALARFRLKEEKLKAAAELQRTSDLLRAVDEVSKDAVFVKDRQGRYLLMNQAALEFVGLSIAEVLGRKDETLFTPEDARRVMEADRQVMESGRTQTNEEVLTAFGSARTYLSTKAPYRDKQGNIVGVIGVARDVTDRKRMENALRASEKRYRTLIDRIPDPLFVYDRETLEFLTVNDSAVASYGYSRDEFGDMTIYEIFPPEDVPALLELLADAGGRIQNRREWRNRKKDGQIIDVEVTIHSLDLDDWRACIVLAHDVSDRRRAEAERDRLLERLGIQIERMPLGYLMTDAHFCIVDWNSAAERIFGFSKEEILGRILPDVKFIAVEFWPQVEEVFARIRSGDMQANAIGRNQTKDGRTIVCEWINPPLLDARGAFVGMLSLVQDVTARRIAEETLRLQDRAIQAVTQGIVVADPNLPDCPVIYASPGFERLTGYAQGEIVGRSCRVLQGVGTDPSAVSFIRDALKNDRACMVELLNYRKDQTPFWNELSIAPVKDQTGNVTHFVGVLTDVTQRRPLEEQYRQSQKMEAFGQLAGGVAHDFNNLLTIINGYSDMLLDSMSSDDPAMEMVEKIRRAGERSAALTRQLLAFSRKQVLAPKVLDLNDVVRDTESMLRRFIGEDVELTTLLQPQLGSVVADAGQMEQILLNLSVNAHDAMPTGGEFTIETKNIELDASFTSSHVNARPGSHVLLVVSDSGEGMTPEVKQRIFEPFFTTKELGKGTGLGLAVVLGIVKQSGGSIDVYSEPGLGTSFKIYLPRVEQPVCSANTARDHSPAPRGTGKILLAEDDEEVRTYSTRVLRECGYTVLTAAAGDDALRIGAAVDRSIDLLVTDVVMPRLGGRELADRLRVFHPHMQILFLSGYTDDAIVRHGILHDSVHFLQKPYSPLTLARRVRAVFDSEPLRTELDSDY